MRVNWRPHRPPEHTSNADVRSPFNVKAMVLERPGEPLSCLERPVPAPGRGEILVKVAACGVCRTDLHVVDGDLKEPRLPIVPGHEIIGHVSRIGADVTAFAVGDRVGIPWLGGTCGSCRYCRGAQENLCDRPAFTGYTTDGGYAEYAVARADYCFALHGAYSDAEAAPLMCAGLIGYRAWTFVQDAEQLGIYGFGAAAHIIAQVARFRGQQVHAFTRPGDLGAQRFALSLGSVWAGGSDQKPPLALDGAIIFAPVGALVPAALGAVRKGGVVVLAGIHMSDIPAMRYELLWGERVVRSVANLTRKDGVEFLELAPKVPVRTQVVTMPLTQANEALAALRAGELVGAAVLIP
jgi:propanol-preferring alcohol dehydrogenase